jgi:hypothetical protein
MGSAELELFLGRQYLDPHLMSTGKRSIRKRQLQKRLMQAQVSRFYIEFINFGVWTSHYGAKPEITVPVFFFRRLKQIHTSDVLDFFFFFFEEIEKPITLDA